MAVSRGYAIGQGLLFAPVCVLWFLSTKSLSVAIVFVSLTFFLYRLRSTSVSSSNAQDLNDTQCGLPVLFVFGIFLTSLTSALYLNVINPASAWDFITTVGWGEQAISIHEGNHKEVFAKHPDALKYIISSLIKIGSWSVLGNAIAIFYCLTLCGVLLTIFAISRALNNSVVISIICAVIPMSVPLTFNHVVLYGYSELILGALLLSSVAFLSLQIERGDLGITGLLASCLPLILAAAIRNSAYVYCLAIFSANVVAWFLVRGFLQTTYQIFRLRIAVMAIIILLPAIDLSFFFGGRGFNAFGYDLLIRGSSISDHFLILRRAYFENQSFSLVFLAFLLGLLAIVPTLRSNSRRAHNVWYGAICVLLVAVIPIGGLQINHMHQFATPSSDTLFSRSHVPLTILLALFASICISQFRTYSPSRDIN